MRTKGLIIASIVAGTLLIAGAWSFYAVFIKAPTELARATAQGIQELFNFTPRVKIDQTIVIEQNAPIMEVATVSRQLMVDYTWLHTWLGSTKTIHLIGTFTAKAGFDLKEPFTIEIEKSPLRVRASLPPPKILSITMDSYRIAADESGWWNRISSDDREAGVGQTPVYGQNAGRILRHARRGPDERRAAHQRHRAEERFDGGIPSPCGQAMKPHYAWGRGTSFSTLRRNVPKLFSSSNLQDHTRSLLWTVISGHPSHMLCLPSCIKSTGWMNKIV
jgi:hypothetical protein